MVSLSNHYINVVQRLAQDGKRIMSLYRDDILDHYHHPQNFGKPKSFTHSYEDTNITCGDKQAVYLMAEDGIIQQANFEGTGCAISIASTSMLTGRLIGLTLDTVHNMGEHDMRALLGTEITPSRMNCAMLGLKSFQKALENKMSSRVTVANVAISGEAQNEIAHAPAQSTVRDFASQDLAMTTPVTKDSNLGEIAAKYPQAARVFTEYGLHCVGCFASAFDTVEAGASIHGMSMEEIGDMIKRANQEIALHPEESLNHESPTLGRSGQAGIVNHANTNLP